jgi:RHS repeat-associated protein
MDYATDAVGNITQLAQTVNGATRTQAIVYDNLNRLKEVREGASLIEGYTYDATGNRLSRQPGTQASEAYTYGAASHRLGSVAGTARAYDAAGNTGSIASTPAIELIHDQRNRLTQYRSGGSTLANYQYSGRGERVAKTQGAATQRFVYDEAGRLIYETGASSPRTYLWSDDAPIAVIDGTTLTGYIVPDNLGTPRAITDSSGTVIWRWDQVTGSTTTGGSAVFGQGSANTDPDGDGTHVTFNPRFPGQYFDAESGLHYNYFRDYEPGTGRYVQSDPIGLEGGSSTYRYADGAPISYLDPTGENAAAGGLGIGLGGAIIVGGCYLTGSCQKFAEVCGEIIYDLIEEEREERCQEEYDRDIATCRAIGRAERAGRRPPGAGARCYQAASERYGNCKAGRDNGPLDTWNN